MHISISRIDDKDMSIEFEFDDYVKVIFEIGLEEDCITVTDLDWQRELFGGANGPVHHPVSIGISLSLNGGLYKSKFRPFYVGAASEADIESIIKLIASKNVESPLKLFDTYIWPHVEDYDRACWNDSDRPFELFLTTAAKENWRNLNEYKNAFDNVLKDKDAVLAQWHSVLDDKKTPRGQQFTRAALKGVMGDPELFYRDDVANVLTGKPNTMPKGDRDPVLGEKRKRDEAGGGATSAAFCDA